MSLRIRKVCVAAFERGPRVGVALVLLVACLVGAGLATSSQPAAAQPAPTCAEDPYGAPGSDWPEPGEETQTYVAGDVTVDLTWEKVGDGSPGNPFEFGAISFTTPTALPGNLDTEPYVSISYLSNLDGQWYAAGNGYFKTAGGASTPKIRGIRVCDIDIGHLLMRNVNGPTTAVTGFQINFDSHYWQMAYVAMGDEWSFPVPPAQAGLYRVYVYTPSSEAGKWIITGTCTTDAGGGTWPTGQDFTLHDNETVTCTAVYQPAGTIVVEKVVSPASAPTASFEFQPSWGPNFHLAAGGSTTFLVPAGTPSVGEVSLPLGWGVTGATCDDGSSPAAIALAAGETVTCTFTNAYSKPMLCFDRLATIVGTPGADVLVGTPGADVIHGRGGDDVIRGLGGDDLICGGPGDDVATGGPGDDHLRGGLGADRLRGALGNDRLVGGEDTDVGNGGVGTDLSATETRVACE